MKKTLYTLAFIALFSVMANAQTANDNTKKQEPAKAAAVNDDGTVDPSVSPATTDNAPVTISTEDKVEDKTSAKTKKAEPETTPKTRMAITEKGIPASKKPAEGKKAEPAKTEKH